MFSCRQISVFVGTGITALFGGYVAWPWIASARNDGFDCGGKLARVTLGCGLAVAAGNAEAQAGIFPESKVLVTTDAGNFLVPEGYIPFARSRKRDQSSPQRIDNFGFGFCMPSGRSIVYGLPNAHCDQHDESGNAAPYMVWILFIKPLTDSEWVAPIIKFQNAIMPSSDFEYKRVGDFLEAKSHYVASTGFDYYYAAKYQPAESDAVTMLLQCWDPGKVDPPPRCTSTVQSSALAVRYGLHIETIHFKDAFKAAALADQLLMKWKVPPAPRNQDKPSESIWDRLGSWFN